MTLLLLSSLSGNVRGQEVSDELTASDFMATGTGYTDFSGVTKGSGAVYAGQSAKSTNGGIQLRSKNNNSGIVVTSPGGTRVKSVTVEWESGNTTGHKLDVYGKTSAYTAATDLYSGGDPGTQVGSITVDDATPLTITGDYNYVGVRSNNGALYISKLTITWETGDATSVLAPVFSPADGTGFAESLTVTASCATDGATIHYTDDGTEPSESSEAFPEGGVTLTQTTTLKAIAVKEGLTSSDVVSATYTKIEPYASLKDLKENANHTDTEKDFVTLTDAVVTYAESNKAYIQDETAGLYVYGSNNLKAGTKLNGTVSAKLTLYNGLYEFNVGGGEFDGVQVTEGAEIPVKDLTVAELNQNFNQYESMRVKVSGATVTTPFASRNGQIEQDGETIALRAASEDITADAQAVVDVTGYPGLFNSDKQLNVMTQEDIVVQTVGKTQATLAFEQDTYTVNINETVTVKATTNSTAPVTYSSGDDGTATVDEQSGLVQAGATAGTVTITATVLENEQFTGATATCTVRVIDPNTAPELMALVSEKDGVYYAMLTTNDHSNGHLDAEVATIFNGKVVTERTDVCSWEIDESAGHIRAVNGEYVAHGSGNTELKIQPASFEWTYADGMWQCTVGSNQRAIGLNHTDDSYYFGAYLTNEIATTYPAPVAMPVAEGYHRDVVSGNYGTICLPCAVAADGMSGAEFFKIAGKVMQDGAPQSIVLEPVETLEAGVPYVFSANADKLIAVYDGAAEPEPKPANGLIGSFEAKDDVSEGMYLLTSDNVVKKVGSAGGSISGNMAYFDLDAMSEYSEPISGNQRVISLEGATGIGGVEADGGNATVDVYTVGGVKVKGQVPASEAVKGLAKGVYIVNTKKTVVK